MNCNVIFDAFWDEIKRSVPLTYPQTSNLAWFDLAAIEFKIYLINKLFLTEFYLFRKISVEKHKAHYDLEAIKLVVLERGIDAFTETAVRGLYAMGLDEPAGLSVVLGLESRMLFKSMTTHRDHRVWQDVYHAPCSNGMTAYIKLTIQSGALVIQFKEL